ncbi:MAG: 6-phosphogluconolactonase [Candidatus Sumerlaeota bacterium]|nr:6-phosphogluconolactonase [Candidatus Sumerlaeota bacterium]
MSRTLVYPGPGDLAEAAAEYLLSQIQLAVADRGAFHLALSGGSTPKVVYEQLVRTGRFTPELVACTHLYWGDERSVPNDDEQSNVRMAHESLIDPLGFPRGNVHPVNGGASDLRSEAKRYEELLLHNLTDGEGRWPGFDLVLLGMGADGHTASLFPGTAALQTTNRFFVENEVPQLDTWRLTLTYSAINNSRHVLILVTGKSKAPVIKAMREGDDGFPICGVRDGENEVMWMIDEAANRL